jgi:RNA polymerase sigma-70 factor (ECF subfamily)
LLDGSTAITGLLIQWGNGDQAALDELVPRVHREFRMLARSYLRRASPNHTLEPTELMNEAWLRLIDQKQSLRCESRAHFYGIAARLMRTVLVDYSRARIAAKRGGGFDRVTLKKDVAASKDRVFDVLEISEALDRPAQIDERKAKVIELRYFGGS